MHCHSSGRYSSRSRAAGYSLAELMISLLFLSLIIIGTLTLIDTSNRLAVGQLNRADMQQSARVAQRDVIRRVRMLGRGGLPAYQLPSTVNPTGLLLPKGLAIEIDNNVQNMQIGTHDVVDDTDVLTVRGTFSTPLFIANSSDDTAITYDDGSGLGMVRIRSRTPVGEVNQDITALTELITPPSGVTPADEALILTSPFDERIWAVVEMNRGASTFVGPDTNGVTTVNLAFRTRGSTNAEKMAKLSTGAEYPKDNLPNVGTVAILEEYIYYVRADTATGNPKLSRARMYPGTGQPYKNDTTNLDIDIAENVLDLQVSLGFDLDGDELATESPDGTADEWLLNAPFTADDPTSAPWNVALAAERQRLMYMRLSTLTRSEQREQNHMSPLIISIGDRDYSNDPLNDVGTDLTTYEGNRRFHREVLSTTIDMRNM